MIPMLIGCLIAPQRSARVLEQSGFSDVEITGYDFFACVGYPGRS